MIKDERKNGNEEGEAEKIRQCYRLMYQGMIEKDGMLLDEVLHDSFTLIHMSGMRQPKQEFIRAVKDGTLNYYSAGHQKIDVRIHRDTAELKGQSIVSAAVFGGGRHSWRLQLVCGLLRENDRWLLTGAKASVY